MIHQGGFRDEEVGHPAGRKGVSIVVLANGIFCAFDLLIGPGIVRVEREDLLENCNSLMVPAALHQFVALADERYRVLRRGR